MKTLPSQIKALAIRTMKLKAKFIIEMNNIISAFHFANHLCKSEPISNYVEVDIVKQQDIIFDSEENCIHNEVRTERRSFFFTIL